MIRVLIADDHAIVRHGLRLILEGAGDIAVVAEAAEGAVALAQVEEHAVDVLLLDVAMPGLAAVELLHALGRRATAPATLVLSMYPPEQYAVRLLKAGAAGYLTKEAASGQLVVAVRELAAGRRYITPAVADLLAGQLAEVPRELPHQRLSQREHEVLCLIASGLTPTQVAERMGLSVQTVSTYRSRILAKMRLGSTTELIRYALEQGLV